MARVVQIGLHEYIHVRDENTVVTRLVTGPQTFTLHAHETIVRGQTAMIEVHPRQFCKIQNPVITEDGKAVTDGNGIVQLRWGEQEIRFAQEDPFPLYPDEKLVGQVQQQTVIAPDTALLVKAIRDFTDSDQTKRNAGDQWLVKGPKTYQEKVEVKVVRVIRSQVIKEGQALQLEAERELTDHSGTKRVTGENYLVREEGSYLPLLYEKIVQLHNGFIITHKQALQIKANSTFMDVYKTKRKAGEEWLVTNQMAEVHILDVNEELVRKVYNTTLSARQYCIVLNPFDEKSSSNKWGTKELRTGERTFFLQPGESLEGGVQNITVLTEDEALLLRAKENFTDNKGVAHTAGQKWMINGPDSYIPPVQVEIVEKRRSMPLDKSEGIYVRNLDTGVVEAKIGETHMLQANEELWEKELPVQIESIIQGQSQSKSKRNKTRVVQYKVPQNSAVQLFDYKTCQSKVVFGPELILLQPNQEFSLISLSGGTPKTEGRIKTVAMQLGPDFMTDIVVVETSDHAKLELELSFNWQFKFDKKSEEDQRKLFSVQDFVGDCCKNIASRIRGKVSTVAFEEFQKESELTIKTAVFGVDKKTGKIRDVVHFKANNLFITSVDVKSSQPVDREVQENLAKSIAVSMDMTTKANEAKARHKAEILEQANQGKLICQQLEDQNRSEQSKQKLLLAQAGTLKIKLQGESTAQAKADAKQQEILGEAQVKEAELDAQAEKIRAEQELKNRKAQYAAQLETMKLQNALETNKARKMADIEVDKFTQIIKAIGRETLVSISKAGPKMKADMLKGLGLKGFLVTDGKNPINLFNTANGMLGQMPQQQ